MNRAEHIEHLNKQIKHHKDFNHFGIVRELQQQLDLLQDENEL